MSPDFAIYVADTRNDLVRVFSAFGKVIGLLGRPAERPAGSVRRDRKGVLDRPRAVAVHGDTVWVGCGERKLVRGVQRLRRDGVALDPLRAFGEIEGRFGAPRGLCVSGRGVLVADTLHGLVQAFNLDGGFVGHFHTALAHAENSRPVAIVELVDGDVLVVDAGDRPGLRRFGRHGEPRPSVAPRGLELVDASALAGDDQGRVYVLDRDGERVQRLRPDLSYEGVIFDLAEVLHGE